MNLIRKHEGRQIQVLGDRVTIKVAAGTSPNGQAIVSVEVPPGGGTPCVTHAEEEEVYYMIEGELEMHTPTEKHLLQPGDMVHLPPLTPHGYRNTGQRDARFLAWTVGGRPMDQFFEALAARVHEFPRDLDTMKSILTEYGVRPVGGA